MHALLFAEVPTGALVFTSVYLLLGVPVFSTAAAFTFSVCFLKSLPHAVLL